MATCLGHQPLFAVAMLPLRFLTLKRMILAELGRGISRAVRVLLERSREIVPVNNAAAFGRCWVFKAHHASCMGPSGTLPLAGRAYDFRVTPMT